MPLLLTLPTLILSSPHCVAQRPTKVSGQVDPSVLFATEGEDIDARDIYNRINVTVVAMRVEQQHHAGTVALNDDTLRVLQEGLSKSNFAYIRNELYLITRSGMLKLVIDSNLPTEAIRVE